MNPITILLIVVVAFLAGMEGILDEFEFHQPLVACTLIGLVSGHLTEGIMLGGSLQLMALGWANIGAAVAPDASLASVASAILMVLGLNGGTADSQGAITAAIAVAVPLSVAGLFLTMICRTIATGIVHIMDSAAEKADFAAIERWQVIGILMQGVRIAIPAACLCFIPSEAVTAALDAMPAWLSGGMAVGGGMVAAVGYGGFAVNTVLIKLLELHKKDLQKQEEKTNSLAALEKLKTKKPVKHNGTGILVKGEPGLLVRLAKCCSPVPGDPIIGFITRGRGVSVHRADCPNVTHGQNDVDRLIDVEWDYDGNERFEVNMEIVAYDRTGIMAEIMATLAEMKISILSVNAKTSDTKNVTIHMGISIKDLAQFEFVATKIRRLKDVYAVERYTGGSQT